MTLVLSPQLQMRIERHTQIFRGTMVFASLHTHDRYDQCRGDDLISMFYTTLELLNGKLPWKAITREKDVIRCKRRMSVTAECKRCPQLAELWPLFTDLRFNDTPDYATYMAMIEAIMAVHKVQLTDEFDWEPLVGMKIVKKAKGGFC